VSLPFGSEAVTEATMSESLQAYQDLINNIKRECDEEILQYDEEDPFRGKVIYDLKWKFKDIFEIKKYLDGYTLPSKKKGLPKWLTDINNDKGGKLEKIFTIMTYMHSHYMSRAKSIALVNKHYKGKRYKDDKPFIVFYCEDYKKMCDDMSQDGFTIGEQMLHKYLRWLVKNKIIFKIGQKGERANLMYSIGYWSLWKTDTKSGTNKVFWYQDIKKREYFCDVFSKFKRA